MFIIRRYELVMKPLFWNGMMWNDEYTDAEQYQTTKAAKAACEAAKAYLILNTCVEHKAKVIRDYGLCRRSNH